nr:uncharacterized protein LOC123749571 [Procambarus clarkii]
MVFPRLPAGVLVLLLLAGVSESVPCPKPGPKGTIVKVLIKDMVQAWTCPKAGQVWSTGGSVLTVYCTINGQNASSATCGAPPANTQSCNGSMIPVVANASSTALVTDAAYYYTCDNGTAWISNDVAHVSQCLTNGNFSPIFDFCDEGCEPPRDCSSVMVLGMKVSGEYRIIPTGQPNDPGINAWCDLAENSTNEVERFAEGGWTLLLRHLTSNGVMSGDFMAGFILNTSSTDTEYFMGSNHVLDLSTSIDGCIGCRPLVLKVLLEESGGIIYHATYFSVVATYNSAGNIVLNSTEDFHGNAGDGLMLNGGQAFIKKADNTCWWGETANLTGSTIQWGPLAGYTIDKVTLWLRPQDYDSENSCQALIEGDPRWTTTEVNMTVSRAPGAVVNYTCIRQFTMEGVEGGERSVRGTVECKAGQTGEMPSWNDTLTLPCTVVCPAGWTRSHTEDYCFQFTSSVATHGIVSAVLQCRDVNGSMGVIFDSGYLATALPSQYYFTAHTRMGSVAVNVTPSTMVADTLACTANCNATTVEQCLVVSNASRKYAKCNDSTMYSLCMVPAYCPNGYTAYRGLCYRVFNNSIDNFGAALGACNNETSALAYPQDLDTMNFLSWLVHDAAAAATITFPADVMVGLNNMWGDWTTASIYNISSGVVSEAEKPSTAPGWRLLTVPDNLTVAPSFKAAQLSGNGANIAICQYLGPIGCWDAPKEPLGNMTRSYWDWEMTDIFSNVAYICYPGYFFAGNISQPTLTVECLGQVGGWCPRTFNACLAVEVCMDVPMAPSPLITNSTSPNWRFLNGTVNFTCPALMATQKNMTVQTLTCSYNGNYSFVNATVDPCNVCLGEPKVGNATTNWSNSTLWAVNTTVTATCLTNYMATINTSNLTVACTETGWQTSPPCYLGCSTPPPDAGANMTMSNYTSNAINSVVTYTCNPSLYVPPDKNYTKAMATVNVTCSSNSQWVILGPALWCTSLCLGDPVPAPASANSSWDGYTRTNGTTVVYTCGGSLLFGNLSSTINITCQDGNWTAIDQSIFLCREAATQPPPTLPAGAALPGQNSSTSSAYNTTQYWKGSTINVTCEPGKISPSGLNYTSTTFNGSAWSPLDPAFTCLPVAEDAPPPLPSGAMLAGPPAPFWVGQTLNYTCQAGTLPTTNQTYVSTTYNGTAWSPIDPKFICGMYTCR